MKTDRNLWTNPYDAIVPQMVWASRFIRKQQTFSINPRRPKEWSRDLCTVHCNIGRRTGKTTYIAEHATKEDIVIVPNVMIAQYSFPKNSFIFSSYEIERARGIRPKIIYVDEPGLMPSHCRVMDRLYEMNPDPDVTFVLLGEK